MAITTSGTSITFNDATTQTTAFTGGVTNGIVFQKFTASTTTWTIPAGVTAIKTFVVGGGQGGQSGSGNASGMSPGGQGIGGVQATQWFSGLTPGNTLTITVGGAGAGAPYPGFGGNSPGGTGGTSQIASGNQTITTVSATGGGGAGTASGAQVNSFGSYGPSTGWLNAAAASPSGQNAGGTSPPAGNYGAGGGGGGCGSTGFGTNGGAGAGGVVIIEW